MLLAHLGTCYSLDTGTWLSFQNGTADRELRQVSWERESLETGQGSWFAPAPDLAGFEGGPAFPPFPPRASLAKRESWHGQQGKIPVARRAEGVGQARANTRPLDALPLGLSPSANIHRGKTQHVGSHKREEGGGGFSTGLLELLVGLSLPPLRRAWRSCCLRCFCQRRLFRWTPPGIPQAGSEESATEAREGERGAPGEAQQLQAEPGRGRLTAKAGISFFS